MFWDKVALAVENAMLRRQVKALAQALQDSNDVMDRANATIQSTAPIVTAASNLYSLLDFCARNQGSPIKFVVGKDIRGGELYKFALIERITGLTTAFLHGYVPELQYDCTNELGDHIGWCAATDEDTIN